MAARTDEVKKQLQELENNFLKYRAITNTLVAELELEKQNHVAVLINAERKEIEKKYTFKWFKTLFQRMWSALLKLSLPKRCKGVV